MPSPFVTELNKQREVEDQRHKAEAHREWQESIIRSMVDRLPPTSYEWDIMLSGVRLARFVGDWECADCRLAAEDHTVRFFFDTKVCLKDFAAKCRQLGVNIHVVYN